MNLEDIIIQDRRLIDAELARILKANPGVPGLLRRAMRYAVLGKGKRLRPILVLESFKACGGTRRNWIMPFCCGIELIHNFSLIHDDLPSMDNDDLRRGRPTLHRRFDEGTAILAADALLALAFELFASSPAPVGRKNRALLLIAQAIGPRGMAGGQILDIGARKSAAPLKIARLKTAELFAVSVLGGGVIAGISRSFEKRLYRLGVDLGLLFQLTDDLLDFKVDSSQPGRAAQSYDILMEQANIIAHRTKTGFSTLGKEFNFFAELTTFILKRSE
ncbi:MAG: polyprenyl synthetase family protein [bacterium]